MDILYLLIPLSVVLVFFILGPCGGPSTVASLTTWIEKVSGFSSTIDARQSSP